MARLAIASGVPVFPVGIHLQKDRLHTLRSTVSGKEEISHWYLRGPYNISVGKPMRFSGDVEDHQHVRETAEQVMLKIKRLAYESEERWNRNQRGLPGAFETV